MFAGSRSIGRAADKLNEEGNDVEVFSSDINEFEGIDYVTDILQFDYAKVPFIPNAVWLSPPCTGFSVAALGHHWTGGKNAYIPKTETAKLGIVLAKKCLEIIEYYLTLNPDMVWFIENPRGLLRKMPFMEGLQRHTITYCQYGENRMKPTDIWTNSKTWIPRKMCKNGDNCHEAAPRGSKTGTQGLANAYERAKLPEELCLEILKSCIE